MGGTKQVDKSLNAVTPKGILGVAFTEVVQSVETSTFTSWDYYPKIYFLPKSACNSSQF